MPMYSLSFTRPFFGTDIWTCFTKNSFIYDAFQQILGTFRLIKSFQSISPQIKVAYRDPQQTKLRPDHHSPLARLLRCGQWPLLPCNPSTAAPIGTSSLHPIMNYSILTKNKEEIAVIKSSITSWKKPNWKTPKRVNLDHGALIWRTAKAVAMGSWHGSSSSTLWWRKAGMACLDRIPSDATSLPIAISVNSIIWLRKRHNIMGA